MEKRKLNIQFTKSGSGSVTTRLVLPISWIKNLGITENEREVNVAVLFDRIIISKNDIELSKEVGKIAKGMKWGELTKAQKDELVTNWISKETFIEVKEKWRLDKGEEVTYDICDTDLSIPALKFYNKAGDEDVYLIDDEAIIYSPIE